MANCKKGYPAESRIALFCHMYGRALTHTAG